VPGPFHRRENFRSQTVDDAKKQEASMEMWGAPARNTSQSDLPSVKAYRNSLPAGQRGVQFDTPVAPERGSGTPIEARWYLNITLGVEKRTDAAGTEYAAITLSSFINNQPPLPTGPTP
jgi:hypothetical protein